MKKDSKKTLTRSLTKPDLAALVVYLLGGDQKSVDTEDIAVKINQLVPGVFVWKKYPEQINLKLIETFLYDAKKTRCGEMLIGTTRNGWRMSAKGMEWVYKHEFDLSTLGDSLLDSRERVAGTDPIRVEREKRRLLSSKSWADWTESKKPQLQSVQQLFRVDDYTTAKMIENKVVRLCSHFKDDLEVSRFLSYASQLILNTKEDQK